MPVALQNVTIPGNRPQGRGYSSLRQFRMRARVNAFYRFVTPALALAWPELLPPALGADHSLNPVSMESRATISSDPTATASGRFESRAEVRDDNWHSARDMQSAPGRPTR